MARQQSDQIFNLSLTRTATKTLLAPGTRGVIGIGRVKTPTLGIVCLRELEIRNFRPEDYFEIVATAQCRGRRFHHAPCPAGEASHQGPRARRSHRQGCRSTIAARSACRSSIAGRRRRSLFDLPSLQKTCGQRWGWTADKTLSIAQELYDGDGKKLITYPRAEARYLTENQIADVPAIVAALTRLRGFAHLQIDQAGDPPRQVRALLRQGAGRRVAPCHRAQRQCPRRPRAAASPGSATTRSGCSPSSAAPTSPPSCPTSSTARRWSPCALPVPARAMAEFRAVGRIPLKQGWKAVYGAAEPEPSVRKGERDRADAAPAGRRRERRR